MPEGEGGPAEKAVPVAKLVCFVAASIVGKKAKGAAAVVAAPCSANPELKLVAAGASARTAGILDLLTATLRLPGRGCFDGDLSSPNSRRGDSLPGSAVWKVAGKAEEGAESAAKLKLDAPAGFEAKLPD